MREVVALEGLSRADWLRVRQQGIGGSDVAAILGLSRFSGPFDVYVDKLAPDPVEDPSPVMRLGSLLEDGIASVYAEETAATVERPTHMYAHDDHDWMLANPDRWTDRDGPGVLECKLSVYADRYDDGVPDDHTLQALHYLAVTGRDYADVAALLAGRVVRWWQVERDEATIDHLINIEGEFWQRVLDRNPPEPDGHSARALRRLYRQTVDDARELPAEMAETVRDYARAKAELKALEGRVDGLRNRICAALGEHEVGTFNGIRAVTWRPETRYLIDQDAVEADHPGFLDAYRKPSETRTFRLTKGAPR